MNRITGACTFPMQTLLQVFRFDFKRCTAGNHPAVPCRILCMSSDTVSSVECTLWLLDAGGLIVERAEMEYLLQELPAADQVADPYGD